jgi:hypothetical protein
MGNVQSKIEADGKKISVSDNTVEIETNDLVIKIQINEKKQTKKDCRHD